MISLQPRLLRRSMRSTNSCRPRTQLANLLTYMDGKAGAEKLISQVLQDPDVAASRSRRHRNLMRRTVRVVKERRVQINRVVSKELKHVRRTTSCRYNNRLVRHPLTLVTSPHC